MFFFDYGQYGVKGSEGDLARKCSKLCSKAARSRLFPGCYSEWFRDTGPSQQVSWRDFCYSKWVTGCVRIRHQSIFGRGLVFLEIPRQSYDRSEVFWIFATLRRGSQAWYCSYSCSDISSSCHNLWSKNVSHSLNKSFTSKFHKLITFLSGCGVDPWGALDHRPMWARWRTPYRWLAEQLLYLMWWLMMLLWLLLLWLLLMLMTIHKMYWQERTTRFASTKKAQIPSPFDRNRFQTSDSEKFQRFRVDVWELETETDGVMCCFQAEMVSLPWSCHSPGGTSGEPWGDSSEMSGLWDGSRCKVTSPVVSYLYSPLYRCMVRSYCAVALAQKGVHSLTVPPPSKRMIESGERPPEPGHPPPSNKARRVMTEAPRGMKFNILTDEGALCGTIVVTGQKKCDPCGNGQEMTLADHVPELVRDPDYKGGGAEEWKRGLTARRKEALVKMGVRSEARNELLDRLRKENISELRQNIVGDSGRGLQSVESLFITKARKTLKRACDKGYASCVDRFNTDLAFHEAKIAEGVTRDDLAKMDLLAHVHLASAARSSTQVALGTASGREYDNTLVKLAYVSKNLEIFEPPYNQTRFDKPWLFIWEQVIFDECEYVTYIEGNPRFRFLSTWDGIVEIDPANAFNQLKEIYERALPKVTENIAHKRHQSQVNLEQNKRKADTLQESTAESSSTASPVARRAPNQPRWNAYSRSDSSYTHTGGSREEWSWWRGQWWSRRGYGPWYPHCSWALREIC